MVVATSFTIEGKPQPKQRPRVTRHGTYTPQETVKYEMNVGWFYKLAGGSMLYGAVKLNIKAYFKIPKSRKDLKVGDWHLQRPDLDNIEKIIKDGLNEVAYKDDAQVVITECTKQWDEVERVEVIVSEVENG